MSATTLGAPRRSAQIDRAEADPAHRFGQSSDFVLANALQVVEKLAVDRDALFPLSGSHCIETYKRGDPPARRRLGEFMF